MHLPLPTTRPGAMITGIVSSPGSLAFASRRLDNELAQPGNDSKVKLLIIPHANIIVTKPKCVWGLC
eukprot:161994-Amphidinium_carterae.2